MSRNYQRVIAAVSIAGGLLTISYAGTILRSDARKSFVESALPAPTPTPIPPRYKEGGVNDMTHKIRSNASGTSPELGDTATHEKKPKAVRKQSRANATNGSNSSRIKPKKPLNFDPVGWVWDKSSNRMVRRSPRSIKPKR